METNLINSTNSFEPTYFKDSDKKLDIISKHVDFPKLQENLSMKQLREINQEIADYYFDENDSIRKERKEKNKKRPIIFKTSVAWYQNLMDTDTFIDRVQAYEKIRIA